MIQIPEEAWSFGPASDAPPSGDDGGASLLTGRAAEINDGYLVVPHDGWGMGPTSPIGDDPVEQADTMREKASAVFQRQRAVGAFNRELDEMFTTIAEDPDWSSGLQRFDQGLGELQRKHAADLPNLEDRDAFERHAEQFGAMQRIVAKRMLVERQQADALSQLDELLGYYAGKAATAPNDVFRQIAIDSGLQAIAEQRDAGYLFPEGAQRLETAFRQQLDGADLEAITKADPENALTLLDDARLFTNAGADLRATLREQMMALVAPSDTTASTGAEAGDQDDAAALASTGGDDTPQATEMGEGTVAASSESAEPDSPDDSDDEETSEDAASEEGFSLTDEQIDLIVEGLLNIGALATMRGGGGRGAKLAMPALRKLLGDKLRSLFGGHRKPNLEESSTVSAPQPAKGSQPTGGPGTSPRTSRKVPEQHGGTISETGFTEALGQYLGKDYKELSPGRHVSSDGLRQIRFGRHETKGPAMHSHFEAYDRPGGRVIESTRITITKDKRP